MDIVSYRGPGMAGGVSSGLARVWNEQHDQDSRWWFLSDSAFHMLSLGKDEAVPAADVPESVIKGHYRYCNAFLWPVMHDLPQYATYSPRDRRMYQQFNMMLAQQLSALETGVPRFVQDYQLSMLPGLLNVYSNSTSFHFWHIPWPKNVHQLHIPPLAEIARGLLGAKAIGFHTSEYAENFMRFVAMHLPGYYVDNQRQLVNTAAPALRKPGFPWADLAYTVSPERAEALPNRTVATRASYARNLSAFGQGQTKIMVAPLGLDMEFWGSLATAQISDADLPTTHPYILSVDRADYTKSVAERIEAVDRFFSSYPEWRGRLSFVQICGKTRSEIESFQRYWDRCRQRYAELSERWDTPEWKPLIWIETSKSASELAKLYRRATAMLVNPIRDGLNLTAKEYVACQSETPGALILSPGAGAWHELKPHALETNPQNSEQMVESLQAALTLDPGEKGLRMAMMKQRLAQNTLATWWDKFMQLAEREAAAAPISRRARANIS